MTNEDNESSSGNITSMTPLATEPDSRGNYTDGFKDGWKAHFDTLTAPAPSAAIQNEAPRNNEAAIALLNEWLSHPEQEDDGSLDRLKRLIDENRLSDRKFWPELSPSNLSSLARKAAEEIQDWNQYGEGYGSYDADVAHIQAIIERCLSEGEV